QTLESQQPSDLVPVVPPGESADREMPARVQICPFQSVGRAPLLLLLANVASTAPTACTDRVPSMKHPGRSGHASSLSSSFTPFPVRFDTLGSMPYHDPENLATLSQMACHSF